MYEKLSMPDEKMRYSITQLWVWKEAETTKSKQEKELDKDK